MTTGVLAALVLAALAVGTVVARLRRRYAVVLVEGDSMLPALRPGDRILMRRVRPAEIRTGQVVVLGDERRSDRRPGGLIVKRVAALPGQPIPLPLRAVPVGDGDHADSVRQTVPAGQVVLLGDNARASLDSRECGYYRLGDIRGVALRHLGPPEGEVVPLTASDMD